MLFVKNLDGFIMFFVDYRPPNAVTIKDKYPLPNHEELTDQLAEANYFSSLDLRSGYCQCKKVEE